MLMGCLTCIMRLLGRIKLQLLIERVIDQPAAFHRLEIVLTDLPQAATDQVKSERGRLECHLLDFICLVHDARNPCEDGILQFVLFEKNIKGTMAAMM